MLLFFFTGKHEFDRGKERTTSSAIREEQKGFADKPHQEEYTGEHEQI